MASSDFPAALSRYLERRGIEIIDGKTRCFNPEAHTNGDAHPSLRIDLAGGVWRCDPCGTGGGAMEFVMGVEKCDKAAAQDLLFPGIAAAIATTRAAPPKQPKKDAPAQDLRSVLARQREALASADAKDPLAWLAENWYVTKPVIDRYLVGLGPVAVSEDGNRTFSLSCPSTSGALAIAGLKYYRPRWKDLGCQPASEKTIAAKGSKPGLFGGHLLRDGAATGKLVLVVGGEKDALIAASLLAPIAGAADFVIVANARGEGGWAAPKALASTSRADVPRELAAAIVKANPSSIVIALDVNEKERGAPAAVAAFARAGARAGLVRVVAWPSIFAGIYPKGGVGQILLDPERDTSDAATPRWSPEYLKRLVDDAPVATLPAADLSPPAFGASPSTALPIRDTDSGNAQRLVAQHGHHMRYIPRSGKWVVWDGRRWAVDGTGEVYRRARLTVEAIFKESAGTTGEDRERLFAHALRSESKKSIEAMIALAKNYAPIPVEPGVFDSDPWLFNVANGTIDLRAGALRPHSPTDMITKIADIHFDPAATCPTWAAFLDRIFDSKKDLVDFMQRAIGYSLSGSIREQVIFFLYGGGSNGKSTFLETFRLLLGDYGQTADFSSFIERDKEVVRNDLADLAGARLVTAAESKSGQRLDEGVIKKLTGGDQIKARFLFKEHFTYTPEFKIFLATNHKPVVRGGEHAIWRRIRLVPFEVTFLPGTEDVEMPRKLASELPGVLSWAVRGCLSWQAQRLGSSSNVSRATEEYREQMDRVALFKKECCIEVSGASVASRDLYTRYTEWCGENEEEPQSQKWLGERLSERGFKKRKSHGNWKWVGLSLRATALQSGDDGDDGDDRPEGTHMRALGGVGSDSSSPSSPSSPEARPGYPPELFSNVIEVGRSDRAPSCVVDSAADDASESAAYDAAERAALAEEGEGGDAPLSQDIAGNVPAPLAGGPS